jgi:hypothetical protein
MVVRRVDARQGSQVHGRQRSTLLTVNTAAELRLVTCGHAVLCNQMVAWAIAMADLGDHLTGQTAKCQAAVLVNGQVDV